MILVVGTSKITIQKHDLSSLPAYIDLLFFMIDFVLISFTPLLLVT